MRRSGPAAVSSDEGRSATHGIARVVSLAPRNPGFRSTHPMAKIKHIAITCRDQEKVADFYKKTFGMVEVWRHNAANNPKVYGLYLSDGYINLAILPAREGAPEGINHFG